MREFHFPMRSYLLGCFLLCYLTAYTQDVDRIFVDESDNGKVFADFLKQIENDHDIDFIADMDRLKSMTVTGISGRQRLMDYLEYFNATLKIVRISDQVVFIIHRSVLQANRWEQEEYVVLKESRGATISLNGIVQDALKKEALIGAQIYLPSIKKGASTNESGEFHIETSDKEITIAEVKYAGYDAGKFVIGRSPYGQSSTLTIGLFETSKELAGVTITADRINENVVGQLSGVEKLSIETIKLVPTFMGEVDPIRSLTTLPGVSTAGELASGFNVRGGDLGQNLILQDGATIYNPSHLFGFFSAFNPDMVSDVTLYKGAGPANFGSRIASVLDVSLKKGDATRHSVTGGVGLITSRLSAQGPLVKNKSSYLIGGRISYCNWLLRATGDLQLRNSSANFYDVTAKIVHTFNEKNFVTLSVYNSYDAFKLETDSLFSWQTFNVSAGWDHTFSNNLFSNLTLQYSTYYTDVESFDRIEKFNYRNSIANAGIKYNVTRTLSEESKILAGFESTVSRVEPGKLTPRAESINIGFQDMQDQRMIESALFVQSDLKLTDKLSLSIGLRYSNFMRVGPEDIYSFDYSNLNGRYPSVADTVSYKSGSLIKQYGGFEPRVSTRYLLGRNTSLKASFYRGYQYMHLISNTTSTTPQDYWVASGPVLRPQIGDQFTLGYFQNFSDNLYEFSVEGFYKNIDNAVDYMEGADITLNPILEAGLLQGKGKAYGAELFVKKTSGRLSGWVSYTYSRSLRKFMGDGDRSNLINDGKFYASAFDQPHRASVVVNYRLGLRTFFTANFNYSSGRPITIPVSKFSYDVYLSVLNYSQRNAYRIPDYHRLDLSLTIKDKPHKTSRYHDEWVFSIFNVYGRHNAYSITFDSFGKAKKLSILGSIFPSISYNFRF